MQNLQSEPSVDELTKMPETNQETNVEQDKVAIENLDVVESESTETEPELTANEMAEKMNKLQELQDTMVVYQLAKDFVTLDDKEMKKVVSSTRKGVSDFKKKGFNYTKKYEKVLETIIRSLDPKISNKKFKQHFQLACLGKVQDKAYQSKVMHFWQIVTKIRDQEDGMDAEDMAINDNLDKLETEKRKLALDAEDEDCVPDLVDNTDL